MKTELLVSGSHFEVTNVQLQQPPSFTKTKCRKKEMHNFIREQLLLKALED